MKHPTFEKTQTGFVRLSALLLLTLPSIAFAHPGSPGHFHPDETDEFDSMAAGLHLPLESLAGIAGLIATGWWIFNLSRRNRTS